MRLLKALAAGCSALALLLVVACPGGGTKGLPRGARTGAPATAVEAALGRLSESDPRFRGTALQNLMRIAFQDPDEGKALWEAAQTPSGQPDPDLVLKALARPWIRPLLMYALDRDFVERSEALKAELKAHPSDPAFRYDVVVVGCGPNGAVAALNLRTARPDLRVALVEEKALPGDVFRTLGTFTWINSPEAATFSTNEFTGLNLAAQDLLEPGAVGPGGPHFVYAKLICDLNDLAAFAGGADLWLKTEVTGIRKGPSGRLELATSDPALKLSADRVLLTTGLGRKAYYGISGGAAPPEPRDLAEVPPQEHFEHLVARGSRLIALNRMSPPAQRVSFMAPYAGKRIAIIGAGDSANNMAELAAGFAPPEAYGKAGGPGPVQPGQKYGPGIGEPGGPAQVFWVNQKCRDGNEFKQVNKPRYGKTLPTAFGAFTRNEDRLGGVARAADGSFTLHLADAHGTRTADVPGVDFIWYGTGYQITSSAVIRDLTRPGDRTDVSGEEAERYIASLEPVRGTFRVTAPGPHRGRDVTATVGRRLPDPGPLAGVFLGGTVALPLATKEELAAYTVTRNEASLNANLPRAAALGAWMAQLPGYAQSGPPQDRDDRPLLTPLHPESAGSMHEDVRLVLDGGGHPYPPLLTEAPPEGSPKRRVYEDMALRLLAGLHLRRFTALRGFSVRVEDSGPGLAPGQRIVRVHVGGLTHNSSSTLLHEFKDDRAFQRLALDCAGRRPAEGAPKTLCLQVAPTLAPASPISPLRIGITSGCAP